MASTARSSTASSSAGFGSCSSSTTGRAGTTTATSTRPCPRSACGERPPVATRVRDLKGRGLLDSTLVHWGGEMGRLPVIQNDGPNDTVGRDHNTYGFTMWLAGGGIRGGMTFGETDEWGHHAVKDIVSHHDYHATVLHLFGLDHTRLVYRRAGRELSLTDGKPARVVREILA